MTRIVFNDANKTELTNVITVGAIKWLAARGFRPIVTEFSTYWKIADIAALMPRPTHSYASIAHLVKHKVRSRPRYGPDGWGVYPTTDKEKAKLARWEEHMKTGQRETAALPHPLLAVIEIKTTRADFHNDRCFQEVSSCPFHMRILSVPEGILAPEEFPQGWWVLLHGKKAGGVRKLTQEGILLPAYTDVTIQMLAAMLEKIHYEKHGEGDDWVQQIRSQRNESINRHRFQTLISALAALLHGDYEDLEKTFRYYGIKLGGNISVKDRELLASVHGIRSELSQQK